MMLLFVGGPYRMMCQCGTKNVYLQVKDGVVIATAKEDEASKFYIMEEYEHYFSISSDSSYISPDPTIYRHWKYVHNEVKMHRTKVGNFSLRKVGDIKRDVTVSYWTTPQCECAVKLAKQWSFLCLRERDQKIVFYHINKPSNAGEGMHILFKLDRINIE
jgi:hypothetical protein